MSNLASVAMPLIAFPNSKMITPKWRVNQAVRNYFGIVQTTNKLYWTTVNALLEGVTKH
jgi:hypothetical protein